MTQFDYANFSKEARQAVVTAAAVALSEGSSTVDVRHLAAAIDGAARGKHSDEELGQIPFHLGAVSALNSAHDEAVAAGEPVELRHIRSALPSPPGGRHSRLRGALRRYANRRSRGEASG